MFVGGFVVGFGWFGVGGGGGLGGLGGFRWVFFGCGGGRVVWDVRCWEVGDFGFVVWDVAFLVFVGGGYWGGGVCCVVGGGTARSLIPVVAFPQAAVKGSLNAFWGASKTDANKKLNHWDQKSGSGAQGSRA